ncbi:MAG: mechanosensitive ion channel family protein [Ruminococcus sp.]|nr:mechanosensitive ion channel family protein [Ruminococcus sp.]
MADIIKFLRLKEIAQYIKTAPDIVLALILFVVCILALFVFSKILKKTLSKTKLDISMQKFFVKTINIIGAIVILICVLSTAGVSTTGLIAGFSAAGAAVALALKDSLGNIAGGILLLVTHPFVTGDYIEIGSYSGTVKEIDIIQTTLITTDNKNIIIPNGLLSSDEVVNYTKEPHRRVDITVSISYDNDVELAKKSVLKAAASDKRVLDTPAEPFVRVTGYSDSSVDLIVKLWCKTEDYWDVYYNMIEKIRECFKEDGIEIPYQRLDVNVVKSDDNK